MKIFYSSLLLFAMFLVAAWGVAGTVGVNTGNVDQVSGLYVFYRSAPLTKYEELGTVQPGLTKTNKSGELIDAMAAKAHKKFPTGEALIITDPDCASASVVKFIPDEK